jgi:hypothetical protein
VTGSPGGIAAAQVAMAVGIPTTTVGMTAATGEAMAAAVTRAYGASNNRWSGP